MRLYWEVALALDLKASEDFLWTRGTLDRWWGVSKAQEVWPHPALEPSWPGPRSRREDCRGLARLWVPFEFCPQGTVMSFRYVPLHPRASLVAQAVKSLPEMQETQVRSLGWQDSPGEGNSNPLQYSCLVNSMNWAAWQSTVRGVPKSRKWLSD